MMLSRLRRLVYPACVAALHPFNLLLARILANRFEPGSVLHVSYMGHIPYQSVRILRDHGVRADYLAVGHSPIWSLSDFQIRGTGFPLFTPFREFWMVWTVAARYEIVHSHFMVTVTRSGWELPLLKRMGRKLVIHYRGCEIRDRALNMAAHPAVNICQECDYPFPRPCEAPHNVARRALAAAYGDAHLVTTPDMKDFAPAAVHMPFFSPADAAAAAPPAGTKTVRRAFRIVHATNHPGIEGTRQIRTAVDAVARAGFAIDFVFLQGVAPDRVQRELAGADLAIGKMKMGYYANTQIESMAAGVPTITYVRPEFMTPELEQSGFIFATLDTLQSVLEHYLSDPAALARKRDAARRSILSLHDNATVARRYIALYDQLRAAAPVAQTPTARTARV
jgi:hypothetical protein